MNYRELVEEKFDLSVDDNGMLYTHIYVDRDDEIYLDMFIEALQYENPLFELEDMLREPLHDFDEFFNIVTFLQEVDPELSYDDASDWVMSNYYLDIYSYIQTLLNRCKVKVDVIIDGGDSDQDYTTNVTKGIDTIIQNNTGVELVARLQGYDVLGLTYSEAFDKYPNSRFFQTLLTEVKNTSNGINSLAVFGTCSMNEFLELQNADEFYVFDTLPLGFISHSNGSCSVLDVQLDTSFTLEDEQFRVYLDKNPYIHGVEDICGVLVDFWQPLL